MRWLGWITMYFIRSFVKIRWFGRVESQIGLFSNYDGDWGGFHGFNKHHACYQHPSEGIPIGEYLASDQKFEKNSWNMEAAQLNWASSLLSTSQSGHSHGWIFCIWSKLWKEPLKHGSYPIVLGNHKFMDLSHIIVKKKKDQVFMIKIPFHLYSMGDNGGLYVKLCLMLNHREWRDWIDNAWELSQI